MDSSTVGKSILCGFGGKDYRMNNFDPFVEKKKKKPLTVYFQTKSKMRMAHGRF